MNTIAIELSDSQPEILQPTMNKYSSVLDNATVGIFQANTNGTYARANQTLARILGYDCAAELIARLKKMGDRLYVEPRQFARLMQLLRENDTVRNFESRVYRQDGSIIWVRETVRILRDRCDRHLGYQGIVELIPEPPCDRHANESVTNPTPSFAPLTPQFVSMMSHELRASLTAIGAANSLLKLHGQKMTGKQRLKYFNKIEETVKMTSEIIDGFLALGKAEFSGCFWQTVPIDFSSLCHEVWEDVEKIVEAQQRFILSSTGESPNLVSNPTLLRQIVLNLLVNAVKYSPPDSTICCDCTSTEGEIIFRVKDWGIGIPPEDLENLFTVFHRAKNVSPNSGSGLGLAIVKRAVDLLGGNIGVESTEGVGTTFTVALPKLPHPFESTDDRQSLAA